MLATCNTMQYSLLQCNILKEIVAFSIIRGFSAFLCTLCWIPAMWVHQKWYLSLFKTAVVKLYLPNVTVWIISCPLYVNVCSPLCWKVISIKLKCQVNANILQLKLSQKV